MQRPAEQITSQERTSRLRRRPSRGPFGFSPAQWNFLRVLIVSWIVALVFFFTARALVTWQPAQWVTLEDRLGLVLRCAVFAILPAILAIIVVAAQRINPRMMIGSIVKPGSALEINSRFILNTFEQFTLYFVAYAAISLYAPADEAKTLIIMTVLFLIGRMLFWVGYHVNPLLRAFGFGLTFYPTFAAYFWLLIRMVFGIEII